jgi:hypothetical protein
MELTPSQLDSLKTWLAANAVGQDDEQAAALLNAAASPSYWVWKSFVRDEDIYTQLSVDATTWSWTIFIARSQGERDGWRQMVNMAGGIKPYLSNTRTGVADIFSGAGGANQRTHLLALSRRTATVGEKLFAAVATGPGNDGGTRGTTTNPDQFGAGLDGELLESEVTVANVSEARNRP